MQEDDNKNRNRKQSLARTKYTNILITLTVRSDVSR